MAAEARGFVVTGTDTGVGKSYFAALLIRALRDAGHDAVGFKPVCCGGREDAAELWEAGGRAEPLDAVNPVHLLAPAAPAVAAELEGASLEVRQLCSHGESLAMRHEIVVCEGVGGWEVPLTGEQTFADFAVELGWPVILVVANRLGALNHTLLTAKAIEARRLPLAVLVLNHLEEERDVAMVSNKAVIADWVNPPVLAELMPGQDWLEADLLDRIGGP